MAIATVSSKFQVVIPKAIRQYLGIRPGQKLQVLQFSDRVEFIFPKNIKDMKGFLRGINTDCRRNNERV